MKSCITYAQLKSSAKERMKPVLGTLIGAAAVSIGIHLVIRLSVSRPHPFFIRSPFLWYVMSYLILILSNTLLGMLQVGFCHLALKAHRGQAVSVRDLFYAFSRQTKSSISLSKCTFIFMVKTKFYLELAEHQLSEQETSAPS